MAALTSQKPQTQVSFDVQPIFDHDDPALYSCCVLWQATLARMGVQNNTLADLVYIADNTFFNHPSPRLQVRCHPTPNT
jgi:hypothetical protein